MTHGGKRPGAGRPVGAKSKSTVEREQAALVTAAEKEQALHALRLLVVEALRPMTQAQIQHATGISYMILRKPDGSFARATDEKQIDAAVKLGAVAFQVFTQAPSTAAYADLLNRTFGKPAESVLLSGPDGKTLTITIDKPWAEPAGRRPA